MAELGTGTIELTTLKTLDVPAVPTESPPAVARANQTYKRVAITNVGPTVILAALATPQLLEATPSDVFVIAVNGEVIIPISPTQIVYVGAVGGGGRVSVIVSPAIPFEWMKA